MIKIELTFDNLEAAHAFLSRARAETVVTKHDTPSSTALAKARTERAATAAEVGAAAAAVLTEAMGGGAKPSPAETEPGVEYKDVQAAVLELTQIGASEPDEDKRLGRIAAKKVLDELGLQTLKGSSPEVWPKAIELLKAATAKLKGA